MELVDFMSTEEKRTTYDAAGPKVRVGIMDFQQEVRGRLNGRFDCGESGPASGEFRAETADGLVVLTGSGGDEIARAPLVRLVAGEGATFTLFCVTIGNQFHWERREDQTF